MKTYMFFVVLSFGATISKAQIDPQSPCIWMKGDTITNQFGRYGEKAIVHSLNKPGARQFSATWKDRAGNHWLFGGSGFAANDVGLLNDLWKFSPLDNKWIWMAGDSTIDSYPVFGVKGVAASTNSPGALYSSLTWVDKNGDFWLFGGFGQDNSEPGLLNTLWKYDVDNNTWTWMHGSQERDQPAVYGTMGVAHNNNIPGARYAGQTWVDEQGCLWLFGGWGYSDEFTGTLNDIWKYDPATNQWTWVKGNDEVDALANYGTLGISNTTNTPGGRYYCGSWTDAAGNFWLFGGEGFDENYSGKLNDLWKYDPLTNNWTWINGSSTIDQAGVYGEKGVMNAANFPGGRYAYNSWSDMYGNLWLFGGYGYDRYSTGYLNDLWKYNITENKWTWVKGDSISDMNSVYGAQAAASPLNKSGARISGISWADVLGNLWLFGGFGYDGNSSGILNDLWKIAGDQIPLPLRLLNFAGSWQDQNILLQWEAAMDAGFDHFTVQRSFDGIHFTPLGDIAVVSSNAVQQFTYPDRDIANHSGKKIFYRLQMVNKDGSFTYSKILRFDRTQDAPVMRLYPNPVIHSLNLSFQQEQASDVTIRITDIRGQVVKNQTAYRPAGNTSLSMDISQLPAATYVITVTSKNIQSQQKFIKQ